MADNNMSKNQGMNDRNQTMQHEQAKASVSGQGSQANQGGFDNSRQEKSAIGGGSESRSQTGEPGRARDEISQGQGQPMGQSGSSPTGQSGQTNTNRETESSGSNSR